MAITQKKIADELGISRQIVGQALNGDPRVAVETRRRVEGAARRLGYHHGSNREARALIARRYGKRVRTGLIVVIHGTQFHGELIATGPQARPVLAGIQERGRLHDWDVLSYAIDGDQLPRLILQGEVDGIITYSHHPALNKLQELGLPVVAIAQTSTIGPCVLPDGEAGIAQATRHLIELGHREIGYLGFRSHFPEAELRLRGYRRTMEAAGLPSLESLHPYNFAGPDMNAGRTLAQYLMNDHRFTALVCYNDLTAMGAIQLLQEKGMKVPDDISVIGFDDIAQEYGFRPALTTISFDKAALGRIAVDLLYNLLDSATPGEANAGPHWRPTELVVRDSTRPLRRVNDI